MQHRQNKTKEADQKCSLIRWIFIHRYRWIILDSYCTSTKKENTQSLFTEPVDLFKTEICNQWGTFRCYRITEGPNYIYSHYWSSAATSKLIKNHQTNVMQANRNEQKWTPAAWKRCFIVSSMSSNLSRGPESWWGYWCESRTDLGVTRILEII